MTIAFTPILRPTILIRQHIQLLSSSNKSITVGWHGDIGGWVPAGILQPACMGSQCRLTFLAAPGPVRKQLLPPLPAHHKAASTTDWDQATALMPHMA